MRGQESRQMTLATDEPGTLRGKRQETELKGACWKKTEGSG